MRAFNIRSTFKVPHQAHVNICAGSAACVPGACRASGRGLQSTGMRVKQAGDFKVDTRNAGSGDLKVLIKAPSEYFSGFFFF